MQSTQNDILLHEHSMIKRTLVATLVRKHYQDSMVNAIFPRDGNLAIGANDHSSRRARTRDNEGGRNSKGAMKPAKGVRVVNNSQERDRRRSLNHPFMP